MKEKDINPKALQQVRKAAETTLKQNSNKVRKGQFEVSEDDMLLLKREVQLRGEEFLVPLRVALPDDDINDNKKFPSPCYVLGAQGLMLKEHSTFYTSITPVKDAGIFADVEPTIDLHFPKLPRKLYLQGVKFLRTSYERFKGESIVVFLYRPLTKQRIAEFRKEFGRDTELPEGEYLCVPPQQEVSAGGVDYDLREDEEIQELIKEGWKIVGDMHSHANFNAFHSGVDDADEIDNYPGFHITVGDLGKEKEKYSFSARFVIGAWIQKLAVKDIVECDEQDITSPGHWDDKVKQRTYNYYGNRADYGNTGQHITQHRRDPIWMPSGKPLTRGVNHGKEGWWSGITFFPGKACPTEEEINLGQRLTKKKKRARRKQQ